MEDLGEASVRITDEGALHPCALFEAAEELLFLKGAFTGRGKTGLLVRGSGFSNPLSFSPEGYGLQVVRKYFAMNFGFSR
jgi:hypothetical protein